jgi:hypothetical protein
LTSTYHHPLHQKKPARLSRQANTTTTKTMAPVLGRALTPARTRLVRAQAALPPPTPPSGKSGKGRKPVSASVLKQAGAPAPISPPPVDGGGVLDVDEASEPDAFAELVALNVRKQSVNRRQDVRLFFVFCFGPKPKACRMRWGPPFSHVALCSPPAHPPRSRPSSTSARTRRFKTASRALKKCTRRSTTRAPCCG